MRKTLVGLALLVALLGMAFTVNSERVVTMNPAQDNPIDFYDEDGEITLQFTHSGNDVNGNPEEMSHFECFIKKRSDGSIASDALFMTYHEGQTTYNKRIQIPVDNLKYDVGVRAVDISGNKSEIAWANHIIYTQEGDVTPPAKPGGLKCLN